MSSSRTAEGSWPARATDVARRLSALVCLASAYLFAESGFAITWLAVSVVATLIVATAPPQWTGPSTKPPTLPWPEGGELWRYLIPGWALMLLATSLKVAHLSPLVVLWVWLAGAAWLLTGAWLLSRQRPTPVAASTESEIAAWVCGALIVAVAAGLRLWAIDSVPRYIHVDEGTQTLLALDFYGRPDRDWFGPGASHTNANMALCFVLSGWGASLFGFNLTAARLPDVVFGILSVALTFDGLRRVSNLRVAAVGTMLLAINHCHLAFSRIASAYIQTAFVVSGVFAIFSRVWSAPTYLNAALLGIVVALGVQTYFPGTMVLPLVFTTMGLLWMCNPRCRRSWLPALGVFVISCITAWAPYAAALLHHGSEMAERSAMINIFSPPVMESLKHELYHTDSTLVVVAQQAWKAVRAFHVGNDTNPQYGIWHPMADRYTAALLVSGTVLALVSARQFLAANALVFTLGYLWLALGMQKSFGYNRATGALPLAMALPAIALVQCCVTLWGDRSRWARWGCNLSLAAAVSLCVAANLRIYFGEYGRWLYFGDETSEAAWLAREYAGQYTVHLIDWYETNQHEPVHDGQRLVLGSLSDRERARVHFTPADTNPATQAQNAAVQGSDLFVVWRHDEAARQTLLARFPDAKVVPWKRPTDADPLLFLIFVGQPQASEESGARQTH